MSGGVDGSDESEMADRAEDTDQTSGRSGQSETSRNDPAGISATDADSTESDERPDRPTLVAQLDLLQEENRRLREEYARTQQSHYRRTAVGLLFFGVLAIGGGYIFPAARATLFALGATGLFGALLTYYLTPETFISINVGEAIYGVLAKNSSALSNDLGLSSPIYIPRNQSNDVRLFIPQAGKEPPKTSIPDETILEPGFVISEESRGLVFVPVGDALFDEFERSMSGSLAETPQLLAEQLADGLVEQFELVDGTSITVQQARVTIGISGSAYGEEGRFDHPVSSFLATGFARAFDMPTETIVTDPEGRRGIAVTVRPVAENQPFVSTSG
jgi:hypothetical protein